MSLAAAAGIPVCERVCAGLKMKSLVILFAVTALASADVGLGYHYKVPHTSYGVPSYQPSGSSYNPGAQSLSLSSSGSAESSSSTLPQYQSIGNFQNQGLYQGSQSSSFGSGYQGSQQGYSGNHGYQYQTPAINTGYQTGLGSLGYKTGSSSSVQTGAGNLGFQSSGVSQTIDQRFLTEKSSSQSNFQQYYQKYQQQAPQIFKHFYVHAAPEEPEAPRFRQPPVLPPPQKHYKIIFIKTPSPPTPEIQYVPVQQQNEEKTIVYVLVKKPEEAGEINIPKVEQKPPSKPEVFFIKYNSKEGSQGVINNIVSDFGGNANTVETADHSSGSSGSAGSTFLDGSLSDGGISSTITSDRISGGSSNSGSFSVSQGLADNRLQQSQGSSGYVYNPVVNAASSESLIESVQGGAVTQSTGGARAGSQQQGSFETVGVSQGLPHTSYGPPNFRS